MRRIKTIIFCLMVGVALSISTVSAQTTKFSYQGSLKDGVNNANGNYAISISLWDSASGGAFIISNTFASVPIVNGVFTVELDFGEAAFATGSDRFMEIAVRPASGGSYTALSPRQRVLSTPYSVKSLKAENATQLGGIAANQYVTTTSGGTNFILNSTSQQPSSNFNISGDGLVAGNLGIGTGAPGYKLDVADRIRIKQNPANSGSTNTAGLWLFQNSPNENRAFIGMESDNSVGFFGVNGGGWGLTMSTVFGTTIIKQLGVNGSTSLCRNSLNEISTCSSSIRYKQNIQDFRSGLNLIRKLRPVTFDWKADNKEDVGLVAEEVNAAEPLLTTTNKDGQVEGVKYDRVGVVLVNAVKEQQDQIEAQQTQINEQNDLLKRQGEKLERQQSEIEALKMALCSQNPTAAVCKPKE